MRKIIIYILLFASVIGVLIGLMGLMYRPSVGIAFLIPGIAAVGGVYVLDRALDRRLAEKRARAVETRLDQITQEALLLSRPLVVNASSGVAFSFTLLVFGVLMVFAFRREPFSLPVLGGALSAAIGALSMFVIYPTIGRPKLVLSREEFSTPNVRRIPWSAVHGIYLQENRVKGQVNSHTLIVFVPELVRFVQQMHPIERALYRLRIGKGKRMIQVPIRNASEDPELIGDFAKDLWKRATGRDYPWNPDMPDEATAAFERISQVERDLPRFIDPKHHTPAQAMEVLERFKATEKDHEILQRELRPRISRGLGILVMAVILVSLFQILAFCSAVVDN